MNSKLKALGLALVAALALTAVMASTASAQFTSSSTHTILSGSQESTHEFTVGSGFGGLTCSTASFSGTSTSTNAADQTITPTYNGCKDSFGRTIDIDSSNFTYTFTVSGKGADGTPTGEIDLSGGMTTTVTSGGSVVCTIVFKSPQTAIHVTYHNLGGTSGVRTTTNGSNIKTTTSGGFFNCGVANGEHTEGSYGGVTVMTGKDTSGKAVTISVD
jgi:hypothetical protein